MRAFIVAHANTIVAVSSALLILCATYDAIGDLRNASVNSKNPKSTNKRLLLFSIFSAFFIFFIAVYVYAAGFSSLEMNVLFGFTSLFCALMPIIRSNLKGKNHNGHVYAGLCIALLIIAAALSVFLPPPR